MQSSNHTAGNYWESIAAQKLPPYTPLQQHEAVDVVVVGAGIVGLTAAEALIRAGKTVAVLEAGRVGTQVTARSTAKITSQHGLIYQTLIKKHGEEHARLYGQANEAAIRHIAALVQQYGIDCSYETKASYVYACTDDEVRQVREEAEVADQLKLPAQLTSDVPAPVHAKLALRFNDQAQFNPVQYLLGLAAGVSRHAPLYEMSRVEGITYEGPQVPANTAGGYSIRARDVIVATHLPIIPDGMFFSKAYPISHPLLAIEVEPSQVPDGMFVSAGTPSFSFRTDASGGKPYLLAVGASYKPGVTDDEIVCFDGLQRFLHDTFGSYRASYRWTNMDFQSMDGLPFVGHASSGKERVYIATGFNAWGITNGTAAGIVLADLVLQRHNAYADVFNATRLKPVAGGKDFVKENLHTAQHFVGDRMGIERCDELNLERGEAQLVKLHGETVAAFRAPDGNLHTVSAVCSHMGCIVGWNATDSTWDCPCHGSRFTTDGDVVHGPATSPLKIIRQ